ncbi:cytochrome c oxidase subunit 2-like [Prosopis cineraria]|uniref:cytochrome c oxidase subunit 2-like n=1 Tax=Prosopis cineraria TaxID=364024 RepID=UPI00240FA387|nr:cytochrome c oxidase subunit 2-like [Prosopis cineraria]
MIVIVLNQLFISFKFLTIALCDAAEPWLLGFQDAATLMMQGIIDLHRDIFFFLILILVFVSRILVRVLWHFNYQKNPIPQSIVHGTTIEILRTIFPSIIPMFIAIPSFALLYSMDEVVVDPAITIKAIGHQWYRTYEYSDYNSSDEQSLTFDSYTIPEDALELGQSRLLEVDNRVVVPAKTHLRIIVTPADVPHSWAVPSLGVKCDAVPGRLNQISISVQREGVYYGQCSEICGTNHAFTPIVVEAVPSKDYGSWVSNPLIPQIPKWVRSLEDLGLVTVSYADAVGGVDRPPTPPAVELPGAAIQAPEGPLEPPAPPQPEIPELEHPLLSDEVRGDILYSRYGILNFGGDDGLRRLSSIISHQVMVERSVEAALVDDGFRPNSILARYTEIRGVIHSPQGELLTERTYNSYVTQIRERGTRQSVPYRRVIQAVRSSHLLLERADGRFP